MSRVYWEGWFSGCYVKAEDWYKDNLVYVNVRIYCGSTAVDRPDLEKSFLLKDAGGCPENLANYAHSTSDWLIRQDDRRYRDPAGNMIPITMAPPAQNLFSRREA